MSGFPLSVFLSASLWFRPLGLLAARSCRILSRPQSGQTLAGQAAKAHPWSLIASFLQTSVPDGPGGWRGICLPPSRSAWVLHHIRAALAGDPWHVRS